MNDAALTTLDQIRAFLDGTREVTFQRSGGDEQRYQQIQTVIRRFRYRNLSRADKGLIIRYLLHLTGYSRQQLTRLIARAGSSRPLRKQYRPPDKGFVRRYTATDVALLAETDAAHGTLSGPATRHLMRRAFEFHGDARFERLATISNGHLYNLRKHRLYTRSRTTFEHTRPTHNPIGQRRPPSPEGRPGFVRIDTVHQGDQDGIKGVYHINVVDCVTQWELVACCEKISESYLLPVITTLLEGFPFHVLGFHADNGSEYINYQVARLLEKLRVEFTKSRPRHSNDNGLAETKNAAIVRKHFGYAHIPQRFASRVNTFCVDYLNPYVNFHRPCLFPEVVVDDKGKQRRRYPQRLVRTPFERLLVIDNADQYLKENTTLESLELQARQRSDQQAAERMNRARTELFRSIYRSTAA